MQMDARTELMVIMMEECGELIQACSKVLRRNDYLGKLSDAKREAYDKMLSLKEQQL